MGPRFSSQKRISPLSDSTTRTIILAIVVLPLPLSPTRPKHCPRATEKVIRSTACTLPRSVSKKPPFNAYALHRFATASSGAASAMRALPVQMAAHLGAVLQPLPNRRHLVANARHPLRTTGVKAASGRSRERFGHVAAQHLERSCAITIHARDGTQERARIRMLGEENRM